MKRIEKKYEKKIMKLVEQYCTATTVMQKSFACMTANNLKSECARLLINGKISDDFYKEIFCVGETSMYNHFLKILAKKNQKTS